MLGEGGKCLRGYRKAARMTRRAGVPEVVTGEEASNSGIQDGSVGLLVYYRRRANSHKRETTHAATLVPESMATAVSDWLFAERISWLGARTSTLSPKLENAGKVSSMVVAPTVIA